MYTYYKLINLAFILQTTYIYKYLSNALISFLNLVHWGYHRQGSCQAGMSAALTKVCITFYIYILMFIIKNINWILYGKLYTYIPHCGARTSLNKVFLWTWRNNTVLIYYRIYKRNYCFCLCTRRICLWFDCFIVSTLYVHPQFSKHILSSHKYYERRGTTSATNSRLH